MGPWLPACLSLPSGPPATLPTGKVYQWEDPDPKLFDHWDSLAPADPADPADPAAAFRLTQADVYKKLRLSGFDYGPNFQGIFETNLEGRARGGSAWYPDAT